ncbi:MAG: glycosyltransferase family 2 protein [Candidatus Hydrogenedentes bacterium]|nr:glycosyltransferase family 2 protein [Candidatus Hydrogenedentota bacterium]
MTTIGAFTSLPAARKKSSRPSRKPALLVSVVVPAYNEEPNLRFLYEHLDAVFATLDESLELIIVDDGSTDKTRALLERLHAEDSRVKGIFLSRNFGQAPALSAGIQAASGDAVVVMDADGQDPPEIIPALIAKWKEGYEVIGGRRSNREADPWSKRMSAYIWYRVMRLLVGWEMPMDTGEFRLIDRKVADVFCACPQLHRLVRTLTSWPGFRQTTVDYVHAKRHAGVTKYTFRASLRLAIMSITGFSLVPLRVAFGLGALAMLFALIACAAIIAPIFAGKPVNLLALAVAGLWLFGGAQCILLGIVGEYVGRTYIEAQQRPLYVIRDRIGFEDDRYGVRER